MILIFKGIYNIHGECYMYILHIFLYSSLTSIGILVTFSL